MALETKTQYSSGMTVLERFEFVRVVTYKIDPIFRKLDSNIRLQAKEELLSALDLFRDQAMAESYSLLGTRADADWMLWQRAGNIQTLEELASRILRSPMGPYLKTVHSLMGVTQMPPESNKTVRFPFVLARAAVYSDDWKARQPLERQELIQESLKLLGSHPARRYYRFESLGLADVSAVEIFEAEEPSLLTDSIEVLGKTKLGGFERSSPAVLMGTWRDPKWILDAIG